MQDETTPCSPCGTSTKPAKLWRRASAISAGRLCEFDGSRWPTQQTSPGSRGSVPGGRRPQACVELLEGKEAHRWTDGQVAWGLSARVTAAYRKTTTRPWGARRRHMHKSARKSVQASISHALALSMAAAASS